MSNIGHNSIQLSTAFYIKDMVFNVIQAMNPKVKVAQPILYMTCGDNEKCSNSKVQRKITKQEQSEHRPLQKKEVGAGAMEE